MRTHWQIGAKVLWYGKINSNLKKIFYVNHIIFNKKLYNFYI